jgi:biofilm protein TabA
MIYDCLENADRYAAVHPGFARAFEYLRTTDFSKLESGRNEIDGERLFVMVNRDTGQGREKRKLEFHRKYIDIQYVVEGVDEIGWRALRHCRELDTEYSATPDVGFYRDPAESYFTVGPGEFAIFYPDDPHSPMSGRDKFLKPVVKVAVDWK